MVERRGFMTVFLENPDETLVTRAAINVNGTFLAVGSHIGVNQLIGGINLHSWRYYDIAVEDRAGILYVQGFFREEPTA